MSKQETINSKIDRLNSEIEWFYSDSFSIDEAFEKYHGSMQLAKEIENDLNKLKNSIEILNEDFSKA